MTPFRELVNPGLFRWLLDHRVREPNGIVNAAALDEAEQKMLTLLHAVKQFADGTGDDQGHLGETRIAAATRRELDALLQLSIAHYQFPSRSQKAKAAWQFLNASTADWVWSALLGWLCVHPLGEVVSAKDAALQSRAWIDEWRLGKAMTQTLRELGLDDSAAWHAVTAIKILTAQPHALETRRVGELLDAL